jgi:predicted permease
METPSRIPDFTWLGDLAADLRYALRGIRRAPAYATAAVLTLAVGIGATTGVLSIVDAVVLRALPYRDAGSLATILERTAKGNDRTPSYPAYKDYLSAVGGPVAEIAFMHGGPVPYRTADGLERLAAYRVTPGFFSLMGTHAFLGREFAPAEERAGTEAVAVLSYGLWQHQFGGDRTVIGRTIDLDSVPTTIVGVMPGDFDYPEATQLWLPIAPVESQWAPLRSRDVHADSRTIIRLRAPRDSAAAAAALGVIAARLATEYPSSSAHWTAIEFWPMRRQVIGDIGGTLYTLAGAAMLVLLLACANVATLALIRGAVRSREFAVRVSLGASRGRIARQLFTEITVIGVGGGVAGIVLAAGIVRAVRQLMGGRLPRSSELAVDTRMYAIGIAVALIATLVVGLAPVLRTTQRAIAERFGSRPPRFGRAQRARGRPGHARRHPSSRRGSSAAELSPAVCDPGRLRQQAHRHRRHLSAVTHLRPPRGRGGVVRAAACGGCARARCRCGRHREPYRRTTSDARGHTWPSPGRVGAQHRVLRHGVGRVPDRDGIRHGARTVVRRRRHALAQCFGVRD